VGLRGKDEIGVYAHIPFCLRKCPYCAFNSVEAPPAGPPEERYVDSLAKELESSVQSEGISARAATVYFGGGTPSIFSPNAIGRFMETVEILLGAPREVTIEANPDAISPQKLRGYMGAGVNRLSIGFQSLEDSALIALGRRHTASASLAAFQWARDAGFRNIGIDLIFATPGQEIGQWEETLSRAAALRPEHISLYGMTVEEGTPFYRKYGPGKLGLPGEEAEAEMYLKAIEVLKSAGYRHYEVSNFAIPGFESAHNTLYWKGAGYIGVGAGAHSYLPGPGWGKRWWNISGAEDYMRVVGEGSPPIDGSEELTRREAMFEAVMLGLRMVEEGIDGSRFRERFGLSTIEALGGLDTLVRDGFVEKKGEDISLTQRGLLLLNEVAVRII